jgi:transcriptional regulator with XRE-family HTH domain
MPVDEELLYQLVGERIRRRRERLSPRMSQAKLAQRLGVSRASVVNIEAGRQHAPLHVLWRIAEELDTEVALLLPRHDELVERSGPVRLDNDVVAEIEEAASGDAVTRRKLMTFISGVKSRVRSS